MHFLALTFRETPARQSPAGTKKKKRDPSPVIPREDLNCGAAPKNAHRKQPRASARRPAADTADAQCDTTVQVQFRRQPQGSVKIKINRQEKWNFG